MRSGLDHQHQHQHRHQPPQPQHQPQHNYDAARLLDLLRERLAVATDAQLARRLDLRAPIISKIRHRRQAVTAAFLVRVHEETGIEVAELRRMLGCRRRGWRPAPQGGPSR